MFSEQPEISPDIEWILLSGQADQEMLIETLVKDYGADIHQWLNASLLDADLAKRATSEVCLLAIKHTRKFRPEDGVFHWLLKLSLPVIRKHARKRTHQLDDSIEDEKPLATILNETGWKVRLALYLHYKFDYSVEDLAKVLQVRQAWIQDRLDRSRNEISERLTNNQLSEEIKGQLVEFWESQDFADEKISALLTACLAEIAPKQKKRFVSNHLRESLVISAAILLVLLASWLYRQWFPAPDQNTVAQAQPTLNPTQAIQQIAEPLEYTLLPDESLEDIANRLNLSVEHLLSLNQLSADTQLLPGQKILVNLGMPGTLQLAGEPNSEGTAAFQEIPLESEALLPARSPVENVEILDQESGIDEILARWQESQSLWQSLFIEGQWVDYGPNNYLGEAHSQRFQAWIQQPESSLLKTGPLDSSPEVTQLIASGMYLLSRTGQETQLAWWDNNGLPLLASNPLMTILSPSQFSQSLDKSSIKTTGAKRLANQSSVEIQALSSDQTRIFRFEIDAITGIILRLQVYAANTESLLAEITVVQIEYNPELNEKNLFDPLRLDNAQFTTDFRIPFPEGQQISYNTETVLSLSSRQAQNFNDLPPGFDPAASTIQFQTPATTDPQAEFSQATQIIADGYLLGHVDLDSLQTVNCRRSGPGNTLAFFHQTGYTNAIYPGIDWFNLHQVDQKYRAMTDYEISDLAFRPDGKEIAVIARHLQSPDTGLYLLDHVTGEVQLLLQLESGSHIHWKPDGEYLFLLGREKGQTQTLWMIIHIPTGLIASRSPVDTQPVSHFSTNLSPNIIVPPVDFAAWQWEVDLTGSYFGLESCAFPNP